MTRLFAVLVATSLFGCSRQPDVVFLTVDTLRRDHVSAYDADSPVQTPNIDALAADGVVYEDAWSPISVTGPAFCTLHTGQEPGTHGVVMNVFRGGASLPDGAETVAERLTDAGYTSGAFVSGFTLRKLLGLDQGFAHYTGPPEGNTRRKGSRTAELAITWLFQQSGPTFLWYHTYDVHGPWERWTSVPESGGWKHESEDRSRIPRYQRIGTITDPEFYEQRYAASVAHTDEVVGRIIQALKQDGRYDRALIVLTADHGESFTERELWFDHGTSAHAEQLAVPLIVKYPKNAHAGTRVDAMVGLRDVAPTVLDVAGLSPLKRTDGVSLRSEAVLAGTGAARIDGESSHCKREDALSCAPFGVKGKVIGARDDRYSLIRMPLEKGLRWELYDRVADPDELQPLAEGARPPALVAAITELWEARQQVPYDLPSVGRDEDEGEQGEDTEQDDAETEALKSLGYLDE